MHETEDTLATPFARSSLLGRTPERERSGSIGSLRDPIIQQKAKRRRQEETERLRLSNWLIRDEETNTVEKVVTKARELASVTKMNPTTKVEIKKAVEALSKQIPKIPGKLVSVATQTNKKESVLIDETSREESEELLIRRKRPEERRRIDRPYMQAYDKVKKPIPKADSLKVPGRRKEIITVEQKGLTYADLLKKTKMAIPLSDVCGQIYSLRKQGTTERLEVCLKTGADEAAKKVIMAISNILPDGTVKGKVAPKAVIHVKDLDADVKAEEIIEAVRREIPNSIPTVSSLRPAYACTQNATIRLEEEYAADLLKRGRLLVGLVSCRIKLREPDNKCYRCWEKGHVAKDCKGEDRSAQCFRCKKTGHQRKDCPETRKQVSDLTARNNE